jgi:hypothetical protein
LKATIQLKATFIRAGMLESLQAIRLKGLKIISLSSILAFLFPGLF